MALSHLIHGILDLSVAFSIVNVHRPMLSFLTFHNFNTRFGSIVSSGRIARRWAALLILLLHVHLEVWSFYFTCKCKWNVRELLRRLRIETYRTAIGDTRVVVCASGCISHTWLISRPHDLQSQYSVVVTHQHTNCSSFYLPWRYESQSRACPLRGSNPDLLRTWANVSKPLTL